MPKDVVLRKRLFRQIDICRKKSVTWISGAPGSGKTTLVSSYLHHQRVPCIWYQVDEGDSDISAFFYYLGLAAMRASPNHRKPMPLLTPEYIMGVSTFALRYFEELFSRLKGPFILVLDNYHEVAADSQLHEIIAKGFSVMPGMINGIVISRKHAPPQYIRFRAHEQMSFITGEDLFFTLNESGEFLRAKGFKRISDETLSKIYEKTRGWAAGLTLMTEVQIKSGIDHKLFDVGSTRKIFFYFAYEIFERTEETLQTFLLKTAFLPGITADIAKDITHMPDAGKILEGLCDDNFFTLRQNAEPPVYQYHPLFREFLLSRAMDFFSLDEISLIRQNAALLLEKSGKTEYAVSLYSDAEDWDSLTRLILGSAQALMTQGRIETIREWITRIPEEIIGKTPWLLYWLGVCQMSCSPSESRGHFERAFQLFHEHDDTIGTLLSWAAVVDSILFEWDDFTILDPWIEWLDQRMKRDPSFPSPEVEAVVATSMAGALEWRQTGHPEIEKWIERAISLSMETSDINLCMRMCTNAITYYAWKVDITHCNMIYQKMRRKVQASVASPLITLTWKFTESIMYSMSSLTNSKSRPAVLAGLEIARKSGVHILDDVLLCHGAYSSLYTGDIEMAGEFLRKVETTLDDRRRNNIAQYHFLSAWYNLLRGNISTATGHAEEAVRLVLETGTPVPEMICRLVMAQACHMSKNSPLAVTHLSAVHDLAMKLGNPFFMYVSLLTEAQFALDTGNHAEGVALLQKAMELGRKREYMTDIFFWLPSVWSKLCQKALENNIEIQYVQALIRNFRLVPVTSLDIENWPYPLKIYTFGRFGVIKDENPLKFSGKVQQKPISLLKAILAFGGREVSEDNLSDALWPDAAGDVAHISFKTNLHRLRQLIGHEEAIQLKEGKVTLDQRYCWVDAWAFQREAGKAERIFRRMEERQIERQDGDEFARDFVRLSEKAVNLYKGDFLAGDSMEPWTVSLREKLKGKFAQIILRLCQHYERTGQWERAIAYCQKALETDDLSEEFYQRLMRCYQRIGRSADAIAVYNRCCKTLAGVMGVEPSPETMKIYKSICSPNRKTERNSETSKI